MQNGPWRDGALYGGASGQGAPPFCIMEIFIRQNVRNMLYSNLFNSFKGKKGGEPLEKNKYQFESKIHVYRATKRMTQQELADLVGVSRQTIMQLERNRYNPSMLLAYSIARVFDVTIEDLFDFREEEK